MCFSAGVVLVSYMKNIGTNRNQETSLVATSALTLQAERILRRVMRADRVGDDCGANRTSACCDRSCRAIRFGLVHNWEVWNDFSCFFQIE
jgi:hypothetical protein